MPSFSVLYSWHTYALSHPNRGSKRSHYLLQNGHIWLKNVLFKLNFQDKGQLYAKFLFYILSLYSGYENVHILLKNVLLQINFQVEGQLYAGCYFHILAIQCKSFLF